MKVIFLIIALVISQTGFGCQDCLREIDLLQYELEKGQTQGYYYINGYEMAMHDAKGVLIKYHQDEIFVKPKKGKK